MTTTIVRTACKVALSVTLFDNGAFMVGALTRCCEGAATTSGDARDGLYCKGCYSVVSDVYGYAATSLDEVTRLLDALGRCPIPEACAVETLWTAEREA